MTKNQIAELIADIYQDHSFDRDGGYGLVEAILRFMNQLQEGDQRTLRDYLLERVNEEDPRLWGIALEVLVQEGSYEASDKLEAILSSNNRPQEWIDQVIFGLLRMGHDGAVLDIYVQHIQSKLDHDEPVCAELAHLHKVNPSLSLKLSAQFFAKQLSSSNGVTTAENCIPVFVYNYPEQDEDALSKLVKETSVLNQEAGQHLSRIIIDYLSKPWVIKDLGQKKISVIKRTLESTMPP